MPPKTVFPLALLLTVSAPWAAGGETYSRGLAATDRDDPGFLVVVHAGNPEPAIDRSTLSKMFLAKRREWEGGGPVRVIDRTADSTVREAFSDMIHQRSVTEIKSYWQRMLSSGRDTPPPEVGSDGEVLDFVRGHPGAVGYVDSDTALDAGVKALAVLGDRGEVIVGAPGRAASSRPRHPAEDEIVAEHGDVSLVLTGSCGPDHRGRRAVLVNAIPYEQVRVTIETSLWIDGRVKSTSEHTFTLPPLVEKELGCTWLSGSTEKRFALVRVSDTASHPPPHRRPAVERPAREVVALVAGATCGQGRAGRRQSLINRHPEHRVAVDVQVVERVAGRETRRSVRSFRLAPGEEERLGCSADGRLTKNYAVLRAEYR